MKAKSNNYRGKVDISVSQNFITSKNTIYKFGTFGRDGRRCPGVMNSP